VAHTTGTGTSLHQHLRGLVHRCLQGGLGPADEAEDWTALGGLFEEAPDSEPEDEPVSTATEVDLQVCSTPCPPSFLPPFTPGFGALGRWHIQIVCGIPPGSCPCLPKHRSSPTSCWAVGVVKVSEAEGYIGAGDPLLVTRVRTPHHFIHTWSGLTWKAHLN
jgi:hypothetical protein